MRNHKSAGSSNVKAQMPNEHLHEPFLVGLMDIYDAEKRLLKAIPKLANASLSDALKSGLEQHLIETEGHVGRLEKVFMTLGETAKGKACAAMKGLIEEGEEATDCDCEMGRDAMIIAAAQKIEHYEIATYGTLRAWSEAMNHTEATALLSATLNEESAADKKLTEIAIELCEC